MRRLTSYLMRAFAILLLVTAFAPISPLEAVAPLEGTAVARAQEPAPPKCCFSNPSFAGTCEVEPAKDETCASILGYLNNPMSQGKSYCGNTTLRGGWTSVACEPKKTTALGR
jgi:hypothetical protein